VKILLDEKTIIPAGVALKLNFIQRESRRHALEKFGSEPEVFVGTQPLEFKAGEEIDIAGELRAGIFPVYDRIRAVDASANVSAAAAPAAPAKQRRVPAAKPAAE
jgi:hypothetical protein